MVHESENRPSPLPLLDAAPSRPLPTARASVAPSPNIPDRAPTTWYRLVTAIASCHAYVAFHTAAEPCRLEINSSGRVRCLLDGEQQWELELPAAAFSLFPFVVERWRTGGFDESFQATAIWLSAVTTNDLGDRSVAVAASSSLRARAATVADRT